MALQHLGWTSRFTSVQKPPDVFEECGEAHFQTPRHGRYRFTCRRKAQIVFEELYSSDKDGEEHAIGRREGRY